MLLIDICLYPVASRNQITTKLPMTSNCTEYMSTGTRLGCVRRLCTYATSCGLFVNCLNWGVGGEFECVDIWGVNNFSSVLLMVNSEDWRNCACLYTSTGWVLLSFKLERIYAERGGLWEAVRIKARILGAHVYILDLVLICPDMCFWRHKCPQVRDLI